ncbi:uncharacterized protein LOC116055795 [Sander lucioperca]|uniref:uncharacterized protein LOC116055795 n=1 Tax=Sander lucioperca TaxID=283035 RepID=UPI00125E11ED|nr:uncharacterized protein LOC116055795 [Sander lucioperca]
MAAAAEQQRRAEFLVEREPFRQNAFLIINEMVAMERQRPNRVLVDEVLHSIFFLGKINYPPFPPEKILADDSDLLNTLPDLYPRPFDHYSSQVPRRSPFSCLLDMVVDLIGGDNEEEIMQQLLDFIDTLGGKKNKKPLVSRTICVSQSNHPDSVRYYGASVSANDPEAQRNLIAASCLSSIWDSYVAGAVMTFYPEPGNLEFARKPYFDGTIRVPAHVRCQTFNLYNRRFMPPCGSCGELFGLITNETKGFPHGNCAEAESLSNLFRNDAVVRGEVPPPPPPGGNRERARASVLQGLTDFVQSFEGLGEWTDEEGGFYTPQLIRP